MDPQVNSKKIKKERESNRCMGQGLIPQPSLDRVEQYILTEKRGNCIPIFVQLPADLLTPCVAYLRIAKGSKYSFLLESVIAGENIARYSFIGAGEHSSAARMHAQVIDSGDNRPIEGDKDRTT